jgi:glycerol-3-phosphate dehydrogenase
VTLRPQPRAPIDGRHFDVVIIGGGINGVAIALECARAGRRTLLVEQNDFASGVTSRSTRIIHGGLRYLEHGEIGLVRESLRERRRLLAEQPHLVRPMQFVLALPPGQRSTIEIRLGLWLYRRLAGKSATTPSPNGNPERFLDAHGDALRVFAYDDAQCEFPERLVAEWLADALSLGAMVRNHTRALSVEISSGRVRGLRLRDAFRDAEYMVSATTIINATGPWADTICRESAIDTGTPMIGGVRGSHIVLPRFAGAPSSALLTEAPDGRPIFVIPWNGQVLVGSTEVHDDGEPSCVKPDANEIEYLLLSVRRMFPGAILPDITHAFAGIRPLPHMPGKGESSITRRHFLRNHAGDGAAGLISVIGGKLTTAASVARECARHLGLDVPEPTLAEAADTGNVIAAIEALTRDVALLAGVTLDSAHALVSRHGSRAVAIAHHISSDDRLRQPLADGSDFMLAEATFAVQREAAITLADILLRRVPIALGQEWSDELASCAAWRLGKVLGWTEAMIREELDAFEEERSAFLIRLPVTRFVA